MLEPSQADSRCSVTLASEIPMVTLMMIMMIFYTSRYVPKSLKCLMSLLDFLLLAFISCLLILKSNQFLCFSGSGMTSTLLPEKTMMA